MVIVGQLQKKTIFQAEVYQTFQIIDIEVIYFLMLDAGIGIRFQDGKRSDYVSDFAKNFYYSWLPKNVSRWT